MVFFFKRKKTRSTQKRVGLALGGGAARGIAHIGVLRAFETHNIPIDFIAGASAGSLVGGVYASGMSIEQMIRRVVRLNWFLVAGFHFSRRGVVSSHRLEKFISKQVDHIRFKDLKIPFAAIATDLMTGQGVVLQEPDMELALAVRASASFPGIYAPTVIRGRHFIDGGAADVLPVDVVANMGADVVIGVDVIPDVPLKKVPKNLVKVADRGIDLILHKISQLSYDKADLMLKPVTEYMGSFDIKKAGRLIELGEQSVHDNLDRIMELIS